MQITTSWHEKGRAEGKIEGKIEGKQEAICKLLARRFGADSAEVQEDVERLTKPEVLDDVLAELFSANYLEEARSIIKKGLGDKILSNHK